MKRPEHSSAFSAIGSPRAKTVLLGQDHPLSADFRSLARSFSIEHVSPATLVQQEISRRTSFGQQAAAVSARGHAVPDQLLLAIFRKWFWARKPDAGFLLEGFPATLLQARVFDEWLETRHETLNGVFAEAVPAGDSVATHYRTQGLLLEAPCAAGI
ncbi:MAG TPA: nucleoside monophosphate kinase [Candidatus Didemnitutus sp.]|nr:nucleoside monophosphate kinase [Candidatus Didemnitutus sp.]